MTTIQDITKDQAAKVAALALLARGLITKAEAARLAGVSRQLLGLWSQGIPVDRNRQTHVAKIWRQELQKIARK